jgi:uncharacterized protein YebE (UPF0316 family)
MTSSTATDPLFTWVVVPLLIFLARTMDMTLSTLRVSFIAQGRTRLAPIFGFFESLIWLLIIREVLQRLDNPLCFIAYAGGFAIGSLVGLRVESWMAVGTRIVRIIALERADELARDLREAGVGVTVVDGHGAQGPVKILFSLVRRRDLERILHLVRDDYPSAFYSIEDVRQASDSIYPVLHSRPRTRNQVLGFPLRKWK